MGFLATTTLLLSALSYSLALPDIPPELYSNLVQQKVLAVANAFTGQYPEWTDVAHDGQWKFFTPDQWTSGFFPASLMLLNERGAKCPDVVTAADATSALALGRAWSAPLTGLEVHSTLEHDVGCVRLTFPVSLHAEVPFIVTQIREFSVLGRAQDVGP